MNNHLSFLTRNYFLETSIILVLSLVFHLSAQAHNYSVNTFAPQSICEDKGLTLTLPDVEIAVLADTQADAGPDATHHPDDLFLYTDPGSCYARIKLALSPGNVTDNGTGYDDPIIQYTVFNPDNSVSTRHVSGDSYQFAVGISRVVWLVKNSDGKVSNFIQEVSVIDKEAPLIYCPVNPNDLTNVFVFENTGGKCGYLLLDNYLDAAAGDNCELTSLTHDYHAWGNPGSLKGALFPTGKTFVNWTATDAAGNKATCLVEVMVENTQAPEFINCPDGQIRTISLFPGYREGRVFWNVPLAKDNCGYVMVQQTRGPSPGDILSAGLYGIGYKARDASGNLATCSFTIEVIDREGPMIVCPENTTVNHTDTWTSHWTSPRGSLTPLMAVASFDYNLSWKVINPDASSVTGEGDVSGYVFDLGESIITYTISESGSNQKWECSFSVTIVDSEAPVITCQDPLVVFNEPLSCHAIVALTPPMAYDNCTDHNDLVINYRVYNPDNSISNLFGADEASYEFMKGVSQVKWTIEDEAGNTSICFQEIVVLERRPVVYAGNNNKVCDGCAGIGIIGASAGNYLDLEWETNGTGQFIMANTLNPIYYPSPGDIINGQVILTLTAYGPCSSLSDHMVLSFWTAEGAESHPHSLFDVAFADGLCLTDSSGAIGCMDSWGELSSGSCCLIIRLDTDLKPISACTGLTW
jgi:hypothetical protein